MVSIYATFWKRQNYVNREQIMGGPKGRRRLLQRAVTVLGSWNCSTLMIKILYESASCCYHRYLGWSAQPEARFIWLMVLEIPVCSPSLLVWACGHYQGEEAKERKKGLEA